MTCSVITVSPATTRFLTAGRVAISAVGHRLPPVGAARGGRELSSVTGVRFLRYHRIFFPLKALHLRAPDMVRLLGLSDLRPDELRGPLATASVGSVIAVDPAAGAPARIATLLVRGGWAAIRGDYDAILVYNGSGLLGLLAVILSSVSGLPLLVRVNGDLTRQHAEKVAEYRRARRWRAWLGYRLVALATGLTFRAAEGFMTVSTNLETPVRERAGCSDRQVITVHSPLNVDDYRLQPAPAAATTGDRLRLLTVTNLDYQGKFEGVCELVDALAPLLVERNAEFVIAGDGLYLEALREHVDETLKPAARERIRTPGFVDNVAEAYVAADVFVYRSYIDGYPNAIIEAQAAGLPVIGNAAHGITEQISDGTTGLLADDPKEIRDRVTELLDTPKKRIRLGRQASQHVERENDPAVIGHKLAIAAEQLLATEASV